MDAEPGRHVIGVSLALLPRPRRADRRHQRARHAGRPSSSPTSPIEAARAARKFGMEPRVALLAYSTFGQPRGERSDEVREAVAILDERQVDFEYDGDMAADVALNRELMQALSVLPPDRHRQRADHAGVPRGVDLDQDAEGAGRRHA